MKQVKFDLEQFKGKANGLTFMVGSSEVEFLTVLDDCRLDKYSRLTVMFPSCGSTAVFSLDGKGRNGSEIKCYKRTKTIYANVYSNTSIPNGNNPLVEFGASTYQSFSEAQKVGKKYKRYLKTVEIKIEE